MTIVLETFDNFLDEKLDIKSENWETSAYIKATMKKYMHKQHDLSSKSMTIMYFDASNNYNFEQLQNIGDWVFFSTVCFPSSIKCSKEYYQGIGRSSYYRCNSYLNGSWPLYEELADNFSSFVRQVRKGLFSNLL